MGVPVQLDGVSTPLGGCTGRRAASPSADTSEMGFNGLLESR